MKALSAVLLTISIIASSCDRKKTTGQTTSDDKVVVIKQQKETVAVIDAGVFQKDLMSRSDIQLVDVRTPAEYAESHLEGAINYSVTETTFQEKVSQLDTNKPIYVYCKSGGRSGRASEQLKQFGFTEIRDLQGGITAWNAANLPTEK